MATPGSRFVWHEFETNDAGKAIAWYTKVVGWREHRTEDPGYRMIGGAQAVAGMMALEAEALAMGARPTWLCYIAVASVDDVTRQAAGLGARVLVPPTDIPKVGRFSALMDPQGAPFALFKPLPMPGMDPRDGEAGLLDWCWHEYVGADWQAAWRFYSALFGWEEAERMEMGEAGTYFMYRLPGTTQTLGGFYNKPKDQPGPACWLPYVRVTNSDAAAAQVTRLGGTVIHAGEVPGGGRIAMCIDPEGARFALHTFPADVTKHAAARRASRTAKKPAAKKPAAKKTRAAPKKKTARKTARQTVKKRK